MGRGALAGNKEEALLVKNATKRVAERVGVVLWLPKGEDRSGILEHRETMSFLIFVHSF